MALPTTVSGMVLRFRSFLMDTPELNILWEESGLTDSQLEMYLEDFVDDFNYSYIPKTNYTLENFLTNVSWNILKHGAVLEMATSKGLWSSRNTLNWQDTAGLSLRDTDEWGRLINYFNVLRPIQEKRIIAFKRALNIDSVYSDESSEWMDLGW